MNSTPLQQSYIGGRFVASTSGETFDDINPATGEVICRVEQAGAAEVEQAVAAAQAGLKVWSAMTGAERGRILHRAAQLLRERNREIAKIEVRDTGKPIQEAEAVDVLSGADCIEYYAGLAASLHGEHYQLKGAFAYTRREPLGVCVGIGAWNYPIQIACWKSAPALACGNAMIFKPAELTPLTATVLAEIYTEAGLPAGVFNVIQGDARGGATSGQASRGGQGVAHRRGRHGQARDGGRRRDAEARDDGARRQVAAHHFRRRRPRECGGRCDDGQLLHAGRSLHQRHARLRPRIDLRRVPGPARGAHAQDEDRRSGGSRDAGRRAHLRGAHESRAGGDRWRGACGAARVRRQPRHPATALAVATSSSRRCSPIAATTSRS
jgi:hypothetical protein